MPPPDGNVFLLFTEPLEQLGVPYVVTGSVAATLYGEPRLTQDVDLVVELDRSFDVTLLERAFPPEAFYCPPAEVIEVERARRRRGHFNLIHHDTGFKADVYLLGDDPLNRWALRSGRTVEVSGHTIHVASPEYVIVRKLEFYAEGGSSKHETDIAAMLRLTEVDETVVEARATELGLLDVWRRVRKAAG